ncbi:MAG TPA: enolase C-terminal domain-like protein [Chthonomonadaceae bacterium]|nr:enolase C-terminal domain-like protein [Chthonomonadaceae bacterium]
MKIVDVRATPVYVPMHHPLRWSFGIELGTTRTLVELITDGGVIGLGETKGGQSVADAVIQSKPLYIGLDPLEVSRIAKRFGIYRVTSEQLDRVAQLKLAGAAIEMACWDIVGKSMGKRCGDLWGGIDRENVEFAAYVFYRYRSVEEEGGYSDPQFVADYARELMETHGFRDVKLKNGVLDPAREIETVRRIRETGGNRLRNLRVDPNQVWSVETSIRTLRALDPYDVEFCEDPTWGIEGMSLVRQDTHIPLATNMCCISFDQIPLVVRTRALDIILGDMHFWGGPTALVQLAKVCETFNLGMSLHSDRELGVSTAAIVHLAASQPMVSHAIDSHLPEQADDVITQPFQFRNGCLPVPEGPGLGVELDREQVERYHRLYLERGDEEEFADQARSQWWPRLPLW